MKKSLTLTLLSCLLAFAIAGCKEQKPPAETPEHPAPDAPEAPEMPEAPAAPEKPVDHPAH